MRSCSSRPVKAARGLPAPLRRHAAPQTLVLKSDPSLGRSLVPVAADALLRRGHRFPQHLPLSALTLQLIRPGVWVFSLVEYGWKDNACLTKQTSQTIKQAYPSLHQPLVGSLIPGHKWTPSNLKCLHVFHLSTYGDLVTWDRASSHWYGGKSTARKP